jgi:lipid-binding SYLF domain-containing protein
MRRKIPAVLGVLAVIAAVGLFEAVPARAETAAEIETESRAALTLLLENSTAAKQLAKEAAGILVFPKILKGGLIIGGQYGEGALFKQDAVAGYYNTAAASFGLQAGIQTFGYAVFLLEESALKFLDDSDGWEIGTAPSLVVVDEGVSGSLSTTASRDTIYVFFFDQKGLMAGLGIQGTKITEFVPE